MDESGRAKISAYAQKRYAYSSKIVQCGNCDNQYKVSVSRLENGRGKYCSRVCKGIASQGIRPAPDTEFKKGQKPWNDGMAVQAVCIICTKTFREQPNRKNRFCSLICKKQYKVIHGKGIKTNEALTIWRENGGIPHNYKGDDVGYGALHAWVTRHKGKPSLCEHCGTTHAKRFEWANIDGKYNRNLDDFIRLCKKCHNTYDGVNIWQQNQR